MEEEREGREERPGGEGGETGRGEEKGGGRERRDKNLEALVGDFFRRSIALRQKSLESWGGGGEGGEDGQREDRDEIEAG
jgi:hypothetical protein